jgi:hypothetical protein
MVNDGDGDGDEVGKEEEVVEVAKDDDGGDDDGHDGEMEAAEVDVDQECPVHLHA